MRSINIHRVVTILSAFILFLGTKSNAQQSNTFYLLHSVPQSNLLNPAVQIKCKWFLGIPGFSSTHISYSNTAFTYKDLTEGNQWNLEQVESQMHRVDLYGGELSLQLIALGHRYKSQYFTFSINERVNLYQTIPQDLAATVIYGNGPFAGSPAKFSAFRPYGIYLREYTFGVSKVLNRSLTAGIRAKFLFGKAGVSTGRSEIGMLTDENTFSLLAEGSYLLNSSMPVSLEQDADGNISGISLNEINYAQFLLNRGNPGIAVDLGIIYRYNSKLTLSASLLDLGALRWRTDLNTISSEGTFVYERIEPGGDAVSTSFLEEMIDTLQNSFYTTLSHQAYSSLMSSQLYLGWAYQLKEHFSVGMVNRNLILRSKLYSSLTLSATADLKKKVWGTLSWSYLNRNLRNIGAAIAIQGKGFQLHMASDNLLGFFQPFDTRTVNFRVGCNIMFACPRNKKEELEAASYAGNLAGGNCSWAYQKKLRRKRNKKLY